jgi:hypothetical protein
MLYCPLLPIKGGGEFVAFSGAKMQVAKAWGVLNIMFL